MAMNNALAPMVRSDAPFALAGCATARMAVPADLESRTATFPCIDRGGLPRYRVEGTRQLRQRRRRPLRPQPLRHCLRPPPAAAAIPL